MSTSGDPRIFFILVPLFVAVGIHLIIYNKKKRALFKNFSVARGLLYQEKDDGQIEKDLSQKLFIDHQSYARAINRVKDIVRCNDILLFRCIELLDLVKYGKPQSTHFARMSLSFEVPQDASLFFIFYPKTGEYKNLYPRDKELSEDRYFQIIKSQIQNFPPAHPITITLSRGVAFIYMQPLVAGSEKEQDLDYLLNFGKELKRVLI